MKLLEMVWAARTLLSTNRGGAREALTPETLAGAIREVLETPSYSERTRYHGERLRAGSPPARVRELVTGFMAERARSSAG